MAPRVKAQEKRKSRISAKNQVTLPVAALGEAGLGPGAQVTIEAMGPGRILVRSDKDDFESFIGSMSGVWPAGALEALRQEWR